MNQTCDEQRHKHVIRGMEQRPERQRADNKMTEERLCDVRKTLDDWFDDMVKCSRGLAATRPHLGAQRHGVHGAHRAAHRRAVARRRAAPGAAAAALKNVAVSSTPRREARRLQQHLGLLHGGRGAALSSIEECRRVLCGYSNTSVSSTERRGGAALGQH